MSEKRRAEITFRLSQALHEFKQGRPSNALIQLHEAEGHLENALVEEEEQAGGKDQ